MHNKIKSTLIAAVLLFSLTIAHAQIDLLKKDGLSLISNGHTHVIVNDLNFTGSAEFLAVFKKYWTITKGIDFVKLEDVKDKYVSGDSYFSLRGQYVRDGGSAQVHTYMELSVAKEKSGSSFSAKTESIADIFFSVVADKKDYRDLIRNGFPYSLNGDGHILNWSPGTLKNYLQQLTSVLQAGKKSITPDIAVKPELANLQSQPIYCTMDDFYNIGTFHQPRPDDGNEIDEIFKGYEFSYKILTNKELSDKILADKEPFYYLVYISMTPDGRYIAVLNSRTGQLVYCDSGVVRSVNLEKGNLKDLNRAINKSTPK